MVSFKKLFLKYNYLYILDFLKHNELFFHVDYPLLLPITKHLKLCDARFEDSYSPISPCLV